LYWSYNGQYIVGLALNEIHLIDTKTGESQVLKIPQVEIRGVSWKNKDVISYSVKTTDKWQVNNYNIKTHEASSENVKWKFIQYAEKTENTLRQDQNGILYSGDELLEVLDKDLQEVDFLNGRTFNLKKSDLLWAWQVRIKGRYKILFKKDFDQSINQLIEADSYHFDLSDKGILFHTTESLNADIYQTLN
jgi:hypothetical protein